MALDGDAMTHEMFENRAFRDGGAYGEHRAYGAKGANPVPEQRSHHTQWSADEHADVGNWAWVLGGVLVFDFAWHTVIQREAASMASRETGGVGETRRHKTGKKRRSTRAPSRPPTTPSRAFTGICTGAGRATSRATGSRTRARPLYTGATTRLPKQGRAGPRLNVIRQSPTSVQEEGPRSSTR